MKREEAAATGNVRPFAELADGKDAQAMTLESDISYSMRRTRTLKLRCPTCKKEVKSKDAEFPFCSERCRKIDLGKWASEAYVIPSLDTQAEEPIGEADPEDSEEGT